MANHVLEFGVFQVGTTLLRRWKFVVAVPLLLAISVAAVSLLLPNRYTASVVLLVQGDSPTLSLPPTLSGIATQLGIAPSLQGGTSPALFADLLQSRSLRDKLLQSRFPDPRPSTQGDRALMEILDIAGKTPTQRLENGREMISGIVSMETDPQTRLIRVSVETRYPTLSASIANRVVILSDELNVTVRQSGATEQRQFIEERASQADTRLLEAEKSLQTFLEQNRQFRDSPELEAQHDRLQRRVVMAQELATGLRRALEQARIEEVKDTPQVTVIDHAVVPDRKSGPHRLMWVMLALLMGAVVSTTTALLSESLKSNPAAEPLARTWHEFQNDVARMAFFRRRTRD